MSPKSYHINRHWIVFACIVAAGLSACTSTNHAKRQPATKAYLHQNYTGGVELYKKGDFDGAARALKRVWHHNPRYAEVTPFLIRSYLMSGLEHYADERYDEAIKRWQHALEIDPKNGKAKRYLVRVRQEMKKLDRAGKS